ncbi:hypothetical protein GCM10009087_02180 [Sphingomonas oligophenolica]|uniref:Uncharacterized protein n=1 Tax=Sphingomonas oligophenolica TaxID=301154 RepID=A0ABU9Y0X3_9SPHN
MALTPDEILALKIGDRSVGEALESAIQSGAVRQGADGLLELPGGPRRSYFAFIDNGPAMNCVFLNSFLFSQVYRKAAVPKGCEPCYKVKLVPRSLRELVALYEVARAIPCGSKWGVDFFNPHSQNLYAGYFFVDGLEAARALVPLVREAIAGNAKIGDDLPIVIKRGCSNYEVALGPSESYSFRPELSEIESYLQTRWRPPKLSTKSLAEILYGTWVPFAFQIGDDSYLDFTGGKPLHRKTQTYDLTEAVPAQDG